MPDSDVVTTEFLTATVAADPDPVYLKAVMYREGGDWKLRHISALLSAEPPPGWREDDWQYESVAFVAVVTSGAMLARVTAGQSADLGGYQVPGLALNYQTRYSRLPSFAQSFGLMIPWPILENELTTGSNGSLPGGYLVSETAPTFTSAGAAFQAFFHDERSLSVRIDVPHFEVLVRKALKDAYLGPVHSVASELVVEVNGTDVAGAVLELTGQSYGMSQPVDGPGIITLPLEDGLPQEPWVWLKRGTSWLDYRPLFPTWAGSAERLRLAGVTEEVPVEPDSAVEALIAGGEGPQLEFKSEVPTTADSLRKSFKTVAAFANGHGGSLVFGMNADEVTVDGLEGDPAKLRDQLGNLVRARVHPTPFFEVTHHEVQGKVVLLLRVESGASPPYAISVDKGSQDKPEYYVRRGSSTFHAQPADIREAVVPTVQPPQSALRGFYKT
jgi:hypothetical protein